MTKLKNTKKGMAKKALSISLVAAMLATSNVPVWAAEFTDGTDAVVEAPVVEETVDTFSAEAEAPVVEEEVNDVATYAAASEYDFSGVKYATNFDWGRTAAPFTEGIIKDKDGKDVTSKLVYVWMDNGVELDGQIESASNMATQTMTLSASQVGHTFGAKFYEATDTERKNPVGEISFGTIQAKNIADALKLQNVGDITYDGKTFEQEIENENITEKNGAVDVLDDISASDFTWEYTSSKGTNVGTVTVKGTLKDAYAEKKGYAGVLTTTYNITAKTSVTLADVDVTVVDANAGEYTGSALTLDTSAVTVKLKDTDVELPVKTVTTDGIDVGENNLVISLDHEKLNKTENFNITDANSAKFSTTEQKAKINVRDLSKGTAKLNVTYRVSDMNNSFSVQDSRITLTGADGKSISADSLGNLIQISLKESGSKYAAVGTYKDAIIIKSVDSASEPNVINEVYADLVVTNKNFSDGAKFANGDELGLATTKEAAMAASSKVEYTGEDIVFTAKQLGDFLPDGKSNQSDTNSFSITYANNKNASTKDSVASITVTGNENSDYEGCSKTFYFKINPADIEANADKKVSDVTTAVKAEVDGVEYIDNATAESYKDSIGLTLKAKNDKTDLNKTEKTFTLTEGTDYDVKYEFVKDTSDTKLGANDDPNTVGQFVKVTATIKNTNYAVVTDSVSQTLTNNAVAIKNDAAKHTVTVYVKIVDKTIAGAEITLDKESYVYTGETIKPVVTVKYGTKVLKEDTHFKVQIQNGTKVGTATVVVTALENSGFRPGSKITKNFEITKANAKDLTVKVTANDGKEIKYDGKAWDGDRLTYEVKLNGVDVSAEFKPTWGENIDAGKTSGKLTLTPNANGIKNFDGVKEHTFEIKGDTLTGTLKVYNENGKDITDSIKNSNHPYTGVAVTFDNPKFTPDKAGLKEGKDYEIVYVNNVDAGVGYICVVGKGNYVGADEIEAEGKVIQDNVIEDTAINFNILGKTFKAKDITIKNGVYASGLVVKPQVTVVSNGKTLTEGIDYKLVYDTSKAINATEKADIPVTVEGIHGYKGVSFDRDADGNVFVFGIDKFDLANASVTSDGKTVTVRNGNVIVPSTEYTSEIKDGKATVTATTDNKNYTGTKTVDVTKEDTFVEAPVIKEVKVVGNKATVVLEDDCDGATGYDYVISTNGQSSDAKRLVNKNVLATDTTFQYLQQGIYWAHCHAWKKVDGKKVFSAYSEAYPFSVTAITPDQPSVTSVKVSKNTVKVTYTKSKDATGYDLVLGKSMKKVNGEMRPVEYGKLVKKVYNGNTVTATFTKVPKGTYYVGLHAYNRTSEDGKKVFSPWSNAKKVVVK